MTLVRVVPPGKSGVTTTTVHGGRTYSAAPGASLDVLDADARVLQANGWIKIADSVGVTSARPVAPWNGYFFHDTTLGYNVVWEGASWRNPATGAAV